MEEPESLWIYKKSNSRETLLVYCNFSKLFVIHINFIKEQFAAVISQNNKPIAFYSRQANPAQDNYTTTETEI